MAKILTYPQKVCPANIELMRKLVMNGPEIHPGANFVELQGSKLKKYLRFGNRPAIAKDLKVSIFNLTLCMIYQNILLSLDIFLFFVIKVIHTYTIRINLIHEKLLFKFV